MATLCVLLAIFISDFAWLFLPCAALYVVVVMFRAWVRERDGKKVLGTVSRNGSFYEE